MFCSLETDVNSEKSDKGFYMRDKHYKKYFRYMGNLSALLHLKQDGNPGDPKTQEGRRRGRQQLCGIVPDKRV